MIYISQGHELGIGLEILIKSVALLNQKQLKKIVLFVQKETLEKNLQLLNKKKQLCFNFSNGHLQVNDKNFQIEFLKNHQKYSQSTLSLLSCLEHINENDQLLTLPTSKDQLIFKGRQYAGHTEFFRTFFKISNLSMIFSANGHNILLLTDHLPLKEVVKKITSELVFDKVLTAFNGFKQYISPLKEIYFSGINPHAGENGLLGKEEQIIINAIHKLKGTPAFKSIHLLGPFSADTIHFNQKKDKQQLFVYAFHDQGLCFFKGKYGLKGVHMTMGLPFMRFSVDHGTAFDLYGKGLANPSGLYEVFRFMFQNIKK